MDIGGPDGFVGGDQSAWGNHRSHQTHRGGPAAVENAPELVNPPNVFVLPTRLPWTHLILFTLKPFTALLPSKKPLLTLVVYSWEQFVLAEGEKKVEEETDTRELISRPSFRC